jgi:hypothetical protein
MGILFRIASAFDVDGRRFIPRLGNYHEDVHHSLLDGPDGHTVGLTVTTTSYCSQTRPTREDRCADLHAWASTF